MSGENNPMFGISLLHTAETKAKMSVAKGTSIYVYSSDKSTLINTFTSARKASEYFNCAHTTIIKHVRNGLISKGGWFLLTEEIHQKS